MIAGHPYILEQERQAQEEYEQLIRQILSKVSQHLTEDELALLQLGCSVSLKGTTCN